MTQRSAASRSGRRATRRPPRLGARRTAPTACSSISKARRICSAAKKNCSPICPSGLRRISACRRGLRLPTPPAWPGRWRALRAPPLPSSPALRGEDDHAQHGGGGKYECAEQAAPPPLHFVRSPSPAPLRYAGEDKYVILPSGQEAQALAPLAIEALRLSPDTCRTLRRLGFKTVGALLDKPRAPFAARFPAELLQRIDQALGRLEEPLKPIVAPP